MVDKLVDKFCSKMKLLTDQQTNGQTDGPTGRRTDRRIEKRPTYIPPYLYGWPFVFQIRFPSIWGRRCFQDLTKIIRLWRGYCTRRNTVELRSERIWRILKVMTATARRSTMRMSRMPLTHRKPPLMVGLPRRTAHPKTAVGEELSWSRTRTRSQFDCNSSVAYRRFLAWFQMMSLLAWKSI